MKQITPDITLLDACYDIDEFQVSTGKDAAGNSCLIKSSADDFPALESLSDLEHEFAVLQRLLAAPVLAPSLRVETSKNSYFLYAHTTCKPLDLFEREHWTEQTVRTLAHKLLHAVSACHQSGVVHGALSPRSVLWDAESETLLLTHFVSAVELQTPSRRTRVTPWAAPEQIVGQPQLADLRTDLYAVGATLYYLLTGLPPHAAETASAELAHAILATQPTPLAAARPDLPQRLVEAVEALLTKSPDARPASASEAAAHWSTRARSPLTATSAARAAVSLGDAAFQGRAEELALICGALQRACNGGNAVVLLRGAAGTGKSRLLWEARASLRPNVLLAQGKFDQYRSYRPYGALLSALEDMLDGMLSASHQTVLGWADELNMLDPMVRSVVAEQLRPIELIIGKQPAPLALGPTETQNRLHHALRALLSVLCSPEHPLVLLLDDLQWSDAETRALLSDVFLRRKLQYFAVLLAARRAWNGPDELASIADTISGLGPDGTLIDIGPLNGLQVAALCRSVVSPCSEASELASAVVSRSQGNPLLAIEIIRHLQSSQELTCSVTSQGVEWSFRPSARSDFPRSENVVELIVSRIHALPAAVRRVVTLAGCIGHAFQVRELALVSELGSRELLGILRLLYRDRLLLPDDNGVRAWLEDPESSAADWAAMRLRFFHDRVQQAAYSLCDEDERARVHLAIGRNLLQEPELPDELCFSAADHLNQVETRLDRSELHPLALLNRRVGQLAKRSAAYALAATHFAHALAQLDRCPTLEGSEYRFGCQLELAESLYLNRELDKAEAAFAAALRLARTRLDTAAVHCTQLILYQHLQRYQEAIALGLRTLALFDEHLPEHPSRLRLTSELGRVIVQLRGVSPDTVVQRPDRANADDRAVLNLLVLLWTPSFWINQELNGLVVLKLVQKCLELGNVPQAPMAYISLGILCHVLLQQTARGRDFARLAQRMLDDQSDPFIASRVRFLSLTFFGVLDVDNTHNVQSYEDALKLSIQSGELVFAGHTIDGLTTSLPIHGFRLSDMEQRLSTCAALADDIGSRSSQELIEIIRRWVRALTVEGVVEADEQIELKYASYAGVSGLLRLIQLYLWDDDLTASQQARKLRGDPVVHSNPAHVGYYALFNILCHCRARRVLGVEQRYLLWRLQTFAQLYPRNFRPMFALARAEVKLAQNKKTAALEAYRATITDAAAYGHDLVHALACERLAAHFEAEGELARHEEYLQIASYGYSRFGATAKVAQLRRKYPALHAIVSSKDTAHVDLTAEAVMRAAYAIAEETQSEHVAESLLRVIATTAGAQRAFLIKVDDIDWTITASWSADATQKDVVEPLHETGRLSANVVRYVGHTGKTVHLSEATDARFADDPYLLRARPRSVLCVPLTHRGGLSAILYLENSLFANVFTDDQRRLIGLLGHQAAISLTIADYHRVQIEAIQAKINPHFLHNSLSVIAELVHSQPNAAEDAILKLSKLYRYILDSSADQTVSLEEELAIVRDYVALEKHRHGERLSVTVDVRSDVHDVAVPALLLQPLVENSIRHGAAKKIGNGHVSLTVEIIGSACEICVEDDGPGWSSSSASSPIRRGFGLQSVRQRLRLLYADDFDLSIEKGAGVKVRLRIPTQAQRSRSSWIRVRSGNAEQAGGKRAHTRS